MTNKNVVCLFGARQSGKSSTIKFITGHEMTRHKVISEWNMTPNGELMVPAIFKNEDGSERKEMAVLPVDSKDVDVQDYLSVVAWPYVKGYYFADTLKMAVHHIFGIDLKLLYGTNEDKETLTDIPWNVMLNFFSNSELKKIDPNLFKRNMSIRELLQQYGTRICRMMKDDCWITSCIRQIEEGDSNLNIIGDGRYPNEFKISKEKGFKTIKLKRRPYSDTHSSETDLDSIPEDQFDFVLDNSELSLHNKNMAILNKLVEWNYIESIL